MKEDSHLLIGGASYGEGGARRMNFPGLERSTPPGKRGWTEVCSLGLFINIRHPGKFFLITNVLV